MIQISCPSCGERGKIPANLVGARIKCKKCGGAFQVVDPNRSPAAVGAGLGTPTPPAPPPPAFDGIAVDGLDPTAWTMVGDQPPQAPAAPEARTEPAPGAAAAGGASPAAVGAGREYKLLTSRDKFFDGKFELSRLEDAINHYARQGWVARSMCLPHVKNFQGAMHEEIVVLLER